MPGRICIGLDWLAVGPVCSQPVSATNSLYQGNLQGKSHLMRVKSVARAVEHPIPSGFPRIQ